MSDETTCRIFFSYARKDGEWLLRRLVPEIAALGRELGIEVIPWIDKDERAGRRNIEHGEDFWDRIRHAIDACDFAIFILSPNSVGYDRYCVRELIYAQGERKRILPVVARNDYRQELKKDRSDFAALNAFDDLQRIDFADFSECWPKNDAGEFVDEPPAPDDMTATARFLERWKNLKPQVERGMQKRPFAYRELRMQETAEEARRAFLPEAAVALQPRPAIWERIQEVSKPGRGAIVHGVPGIGKTSLMQWIVREHGSRISALWRCRREAPASWDVSAFARSIALQLAATTPEYAAKVDLGNSAYAELFLDRVTTTDPGTALRHAALVPLRALESPPSEPRYVLVDGLDEAPEFDDKRLTIPELLRSCHKEFPSWLRLVATAQTHYLESEETAHFGDWAELALDPHDTAHRADLLAHVRSQFGDPKYGDLLRSSGVDADAAAEAAAKTADGNFLVAVWLLNTLSNDWENKRRKATDEGETLDAEQFRAWVADPPPVGDYIVARLERRFKDPNSAEWRSASRFLAALTIARRPLYNGELARLTSLSLAEIRDLKSKFGAILKVWNVRKSQGTSERDKADDPRAFRCDFFHNGVRKWLRLARDYAVDESEGRRDVSRAMEEEIAEGNPPSLPYLREFGLQHVLADGRIELAVDLLGTLVKEEEIQETTIGIPAMVKDVFYAIERMREKNVARVRKIDPERLAVLMDRGCGEIPALYPPARILFDHHLEVWPKVRQMLVDSDDLLTRYTLGRAIADSYVHWNDAGRRSQILREIDSCFDGIPSNGSNGDAKRESNEGMGAYNVRQWARYAWRFLMPQPMIGEARTRLSDGMAKLSASDDYNDHMILWECLLEGAMTGELLPKNVSFDAIDESFRVPRWPYLRLDMLEFAAQCENQRRSALPWLGDSPEIRQEIELVQTRLRHAKAEIKALKEKYSGEPDLGRALTEWQAPAKLNAALRKTTDELLNLPYSQVARYLSPFVLHPSWEVMETAASIAAMLCEFRPEMPKLVAAWAQSPYWQARYAAVDTAFNSRNSRVGEEALGPLGAIARDERVRVDLFKHKMGEQAFDVLIDALHDDPVSRVQFIVAEDLFYLLDDYEMSFRGTTPPAFDDCPDHGFYRCVARYEKPIRYWLATAADCTLLDEVFQFVHAVMKGRRPDDGDDVKSAGLIAAQPLLEEWLSGKITKYLAVQENWWELDRAEWLKRLKSERDGDL